MSRWLKVFTMVALAVCLVSTAADARSHRGRSRGSRYGRVVVGPGMISPAQANAAAWAAYNRNLYGTGNGYRSAR